MDFIQIYASIVYILDEFYIGLTATQGFQDGQ